MSLTQSHMGDHPDNYYFHGQVNLIDSSVRNTFQFVIPEGDQKTYRLAQMDTCTHIQRKNFRFHPPVKISLQARVSDNILPGTWGFGLWNDPFSAGIGIKGSGLRLPYLPQAAWFFYGSSKNDLSFSQETENNGLMASVFSSRKIPPVWFLFGLPVLPLLFFRPVSRQLRRLTSCFIHEESQKADINASYWHEYELIWLDDKVQFMIDKKMIHDTNLSPCPPLGLVIWIDNQYASYSSNGAIRFGLEANPQSAWLEIRNLEITA